MPFKSKAQLRTCYAKKLQAEAQGKISTWDCDKFLEETKDPDCLPERVGDTPRSSCRTLRKEEKITGPVYIGSRGGLYFYVADVKVYIGANKQVYDYVMRTYKPIPEPKSKGSPKHSPSKRKSPTRSSGEYQWQLVSRSKPEAKYYDVLYQIRPLPTRTSPRRHN